MNFSKIKQNNLLFFVILFSILASFSFVHISLSVILTLIALVFVIKLNFEDGFIFTMFTSSFCMSFGYKNICYSYLFLAILILTFKAYAINKDKWTSLKKSTKIILGFSLVYLFIQPIVYLIGFKSVKGLAILPKLYTFILMFLLIFLSRGRVNIEKFTKYFVAGILFSCTLSAVGFATGLIDYKVFMWEKGVEKVWRFTGIYPSVNLLATTCILGLCLLITNIFKQPKRISNYILIFTLIILGLITASELFLVLLVILCLLVLVYTFVKTKNKKLWCKYFGLFVIVCGLVCLALIPYIKMMNRKIACMFSDSSFLETITMNQIHIWKKYYNDFVSKPIYILFGKSFMGKFNIGGGLSNTLLAFIYQYGIIGTLIFTILTVIMIKNSKGFSKNFSRYLPIIFVLISSLILDHIFTGVGSICVIVATMSAFNCEETKVENESNIVSYQLYLFIKRSFDIAVSVVALILASIPMLILAVLIKATSKGPVFFRDKRIGKDGKQIIVYKFRSMYVDAESRLEQYLTKEQLELWKTERKIDNDPRITKLGKIIRKTSLDELPQLINILKGDLSLIGNRPISKLEYDTWFSDEEKEKINTMRPGLTGYWQVYGRSEVDWQSGKRKAMCMYYSEKASIWLDIKIFFKTFIVVIFRKGAK